MQVGMSKLERVLRGFIGQDVGAPVPITPELTVDEDFRRATEEVLLAQAATGEGVILGRAAAIVLRDRPNVEEIELSEAEHTVEQLDRAHAEYVKRFYGADIRDPSLYDLVLDSTAIELDTCVELLVTAVRSLRSAS